MVRRKLQIFVQDAVLLHLTTVRRVGGVHAEMLSIAGGILRLNGGVPVC